MGKIYLILLMGALSFVIFSSTPTWADKIFLKEREEGNEVEVIEEGTDSFIIKVPKEEISRIEKERPSEIKLWERKKILWEDKGDYIAIHLPKERIVQTGEGAGEIQYETVRSLEEGLKTTGAEIVSPDLKMKGRVKGRILEKGKPLWGCSVKLRYGPGQAALLPRLYLRDLEGKDIVFEATTDKEGFYEFTNLPPGDYDIFWRPPGEERWTRRLSEKADITVLPGETVTYKDIEVRRGR